MHSEWYSIPEATVAGRREGAGRRRGAWSRWARRRCARSSRRPRKASFAPGSAETRLFIVPGYEFRVVDRLVTNFHLPRSTLLMLVSAFAGAANIRRAYEHAV